jgi:hypothetical protein
MLHANKVLLHNAESLTVVEGLTSSYEVYAVFIPVIFYRKTSLGARKNSSALSGVPLVLFAHVASTGWYELSDLSFEFWGLSTSLS